MGWRSPYIRNCDVSDTVTSCIELFHIYIYIHHSIDFLFFDISDAILPTGIHIDGHRWQRLNGSSSRYVCMCVSKSHDIEFKLFVLYMEITDVVSNSKQPASVHSLLTKYRHFRF